MRARSAALALLVGLGAGAGQAVCAGPGEAQTKPTAKAPAKPTGKPTPPSPLLQAYRSFCYDTRAETKAAVARAGAAGWRAPLLPPAGAPPGLTFRTRQIGATRLDLMAGEQDMPAGQRYPFPTRIRLCIVTASPRPVPVHKAMRALIGADAISREGGTWSWGYSEAGGKRDFAPPATREDANARVSQGSMIIINARETPKDSALGFTRVTRSGGG